MCIVVIGFMMSIKNSNMCDEKLVWDFQREEMRITDGTENLAEPESRHGNGSEQLEMGGNGIEKDTPAHIYDRRTSIHKHTEGRN